MCFPNLPPPPSQGLIKNILNVYRRGDYVGNRVPLQSTRMPRVPLLLVPVIRTFILHSGDEAQCTDNAL